MKGNFSKNPIELMISTLQACILLLFNDAPELSYQDIQASLHTYSSAPGGHARRMH